MMYANYKVTFREVPDEISLSFGISECPYKCKGCHSHELQTDIGEELTEKIIDRFTAKNDGVTCVCFLGGDGKKEDLLRLLKYVKSKGLKTAWYSGNQQFPLPEEKELLDNLDYIKIGPYVEKLGDLTKKTTNQIFYRKSPNGVWEDITYKFRNNGINNLYMLINRRLQFLGSALDKRRQKKGKDKGVI